jgi:nucleoside-diphosphate-sugar epimerase
VNFVHGNINNRAELKPHIDWADAGVWLAALVRDPACALSPELTVRTNVLAAAQLVSKLSDRLLFPSTCSVYGAQDGLLNEESPFDPLSIYAESKIRAEKVLLQAPYVRLWMPVHF